MMMDKMKKANAGNLNRSCNLFNLSILCLRPLSCYVQFVKAAVLLRSQETAESSTAAEPFSVCFQTREIKIP